MPWLAAVGAIAGAGASAYGANAAGNQMEQGLKLGSQQLTGANAMANLQLAPYQDTGLAALYTLGGAAGLNLEPNLQSAAQLSAQLGVTLPPEVQTFEQAIAYAAQMQERVDAPHNKAKWQQLAQLLTQGQRQNESIQAASQGAGALAPRPEYQQYADWQYTGAPPEVPQLQQFQYEGQQPGAVNYNRDIPMGNIPAPFQYGDRVQDFSYQGEIPEYANFDAEKMRLDPGYRFRLQQGERALAATAANKGQLRSGKFARDVTSFGQDLASQEYQNAFGRYLTEYGIGRENEATQRARQVQEYELNRIAEEARYARSRGEYDLAAQLEQEAFQRSRSAEQELYGRGQTAYGQDVAREQEARRRAVENYGIGQARDLTQYQLDTAREGTIRDRALQDWLTNYQKSEGQQATEYARWADDWNRMAGLAGAGQTAATNVASQTSQTGANQANLAITSGQNQANTIGAATQSFNNLVGDMVSGYYYGQGQQQPGGSTPGGAGSQSNPTTYQDMDAWDLDQ